MTPAQEMDRTVAAICRHHIDCGLPGELVIDVGGYCELTGDGVQHPPGQIRVGIEDVVPVLDDWGRERPQGDPHVNRKWAWSAAKISMYAGDTDRSAVIAGVARCTFETEAEAAAEQKCAVGLFSGLGIASHGFVTGDAHSSERHHMVVWFFGILDKPEGADSINRLRDQMPQNWFGRDSHWMHLPTCCGDLLHFDLSFSLQGTPVRVVSIAALAAGLGRWHAVGRDADLFSRCGRRSERSDGNERPKWVVDGLLPAGTVTLMAGAQMTGKSTLATEIGVAVANDIGQRTVIGRDVVPENAGGLVAILSGEDSIGVLNARLEAMDPDDSVARLVTYALDARTLAELCEALAAAPRLSLVIVDPARRYLDGDEDGSDGVNRFFSTLEALASRTGAAVLVLHHLTKNAAPTSLLAVREAVRGSGVWLDRPRVMIGMYRRGGKTMIGVGKHNFPPSFPMMEEGAFTRDATTLRHLAVAKADAADSAAESDGLERKVLAAIDRLRAEGTIVMSRGAAELWRLQPPELDGVGRNRTREAVDALIADGLVLKNPAGLEVAP